MRRRPHLPPAGRGQAALRLTSAAAHGEFRLPVCNGCGHVQYPPAEFCQSCLSDDLTWAKVAPEGRVLATTVLRKSTSRHFETRLPWPIGTIRLDAGPIVVAHLGPDVAKVGAEVKLLNRLDTSGQAVFIAVARDQTQEVIREARLPEQQHNTEIAGKTVLITGASGGIGSALVNAFQAAGAGQVYAAARDPSQIAMADDERIAPIALDVTDPASIAALEAGPLGETEILINVAGRNHNEGLLSADDIDLAEEEIAVNYLGTLRLVRAVAPHMKERNAGIIVNLATILAHVNLPLMGSYCASKAALLSLTQGIRAELMPWGVRVMGVFPGAVDTAMSADFRPPKMSTTAVARAVVEAIQDNIEDSYPGDMAQALREKLLEDPKAVERDLGALLPEPH